MGRKYKRLYEQVCAFENLWLASRKARRGKRLKPAVVEFEHDLEENLLNIEQQLREENYTFGGYNFFTITDPQERLIAAAPYRDRVVHHALCNIIEPLLDRAMIYDSYACRLNKGLHRALERAQGFLRANAWVLKIDIRKYFFTIDHEILKQDLAKKITDQQVMKLIGQILATHCSPREYYFPFNGEQAPDYQRAIGLPIGNLTSQLFANYYLTPLDRFIKEELKFKCYLRYMDDALVFSPTKEALAEALESIRDFLEKRRLQLHQGKSQVFPARHGVRFLGFHLYPYKKKISRPNLKRFKKRMKAKSWRYGNEELEWERLLLSLNAWLGFANKRENRKFVNEVLSAIRFTNRSNGQPFTFWIPGDSKEEKTLILSK